jgi:UDP-2-acetamido-3-amino-2,3-dideoxy-glucuronate N-acetyltransferase
MKRLKICVVGVGKWGINHVKTLTSLRVDVGCIDFDQNRLNFLKESFPNVKIFRSVEESLADNYDGYVIATPPSSHSEIAKFLILNNKPILVEKPLSLSIDEAQDLKKVLLDNNGKLVVGHLLLFHPAIQKIKSIINEGKIGKIQYIYSNRLNLGTVRTEENVFWSFAPHDISLFQYIANSFPVNVYSYGGDFVNKGIHDTTITYLKYPNDIQGHIFVSWLHPFKEHRLVIIGSKGSLHFEDSARGKPLLYYGGEKLGYETKAEKRGKAFKKINYKDTLPLNNELKYFMNIIQGGKLEKANIEEGIDVIKILEMATSSLKMKE